MIPRLFFRFLHLLSPVNTYIFRTQLRQVETFVSTFLFSMFLVLSLFHQQKSFFRLNKITIDDHSFTASLFYFLLLLLFLLGIFADRIDLDRICTFTYYFETKSNEYCWFYSRLFCVCFVSVMFVSFFYFVCYIRRL